MSENAEKGDKGIENEDRMGTNVYSSIDNKSLHKSLNGEFLFYQLLLERISNENDLQIFQKSSLSKCLKSVDEKDREILIEFDQSYKSAKAIHWYTRESCIYKMLNKALRTHDIENVIPFGLFIRDIQKQLLEEYHSFIQKQNQSNIKVYRGQLISKDELNRLKSGKNQLISMNSFLSTSRNRQKALEFATSKPPPNAELTSILLEMNINLLSFIKPFADIKHLSAFPKEEEILFMISSIFRLNQIIYDQTNQVWIANLTSTSPNDKDIQKFLSVLKNDLKGQNPFIALGNYFIDIFKYDQAKRHFEYILSNNLIKNPNELAYCYHGLAIVSNKQGNSKLSIEYLNKSLNSLPNNHPLIRQCFNQLGFIYLNENDFINAFDSFEKSLNQTNNNNNNDDLSKTYFGLAQIHFKMKNYLISLEYLGKTLENQSKNDYAFLANTYMYMANVHSARNKKEKALEYYQKSTEYQLKDLPSNHPDLAYTYNAQAAMHFNFQENQKSFEFIERAHQLQSQTLPSHHPDFIESYQNFANLYIQNGNLDKALVYYEKCLENQLKTLPSNHPSIIQTYTNLANIYLKQKNSEQASIYFEKMLNAQLESNISSHSQISSSLKTLADFYFDQYQRNENQFNLDNALKYSLNYLNHQLKILFNQDIQLASIYQKIAQIYYKKTQLSQSLIYYNRLLDCYLQKIPIDQAMIDKIYSNIQQIYLRKTNFDQSLLYYNSMEKNSIDNEYEYINNIHFERRHLHLALNYFQNLLQKQIEQNSKKEIYQILANISLEQKDFHQSLEYLNILLNYSSDQKQVDHSSSEYLYTTIAHIYLQLKDYSQSFEYLFKFLDYQLESKSINDPSIINIYKLIGKIYLTKHKTQDISKKIIKRNIHFQTNHLDQILIFFKNSRNNNQFDYSLNDINTILAYIYLEKQNLNKSLKYFEQIIKNQSDQTNTNNSSLAYTHFIIANIYQKLNNSKQALQNYQRSLAIYQRIHPQNSPTIDKIQRKINNLTFFSTQ